MTDLFQDKAREWDTRPLSQILATGVSTALLAQVPFTPEMRVMDFGAGTGLLRISSILFSLNRIG